MTAICKRTSTAEAVEGSLIPKFNQENHLFISIFNSIISFPKFYKRIR